VRSAGRRGRVDRDAALLVRGRDGFALAEAADAVIAKLHAASVTVAAAACGLRVRGGGEIAPVDIVTPAAPGLVL
jgi:hypothetical protein